MVTPEPTGTQDPRFPRDQFISWLAFSLGIGLLQVWTIVLVILAIQFFWYDVQIGGRLIQFQTADILGNSVLLFFATSILGQAVYTLWNKRPLAGYHFLYAGLALIGVLVMVITLYVLTIMLKEPKTSGKYVLDGATALFSFVYATYVEFFVRK